VAKPLGQKPVLRNTHPLLDHRLAMSANGYAINPCTLKTRTCKGWPTIPYDEVSLHRDSRWRDEYFAGTAIRIEGDLCAWDMDVSIPKIAKLLLKDLVRIDPENTSKAISRTSGAVSRAVFFRTPKPFSRRATQRYTAYPDRLAALIEARELPEATDEEHFTKANLIRVLTASLEPQHVEFWGPERKGRYFQVEGPHSEGRVYQCEGLAPWNTRKDELPFIVMDPGDYIDRAEKILAKHLTLIPDAETYSADVVYDLEPEGEFIAKDGTAITYGELLGTLEPGAENGMRGCLSWAAYAASNSQANCNAYVTSGRHQLVVRDWSHNGVEHRMKADEPPPPVEIDDNTRAILQSMVDAASLGVLKGMAEGAAAPKSDPMDDEPEQTPPPSFDDIQRGDEPETAYDNAVKWLLVNMAYYAGANRGHGGVISIHPAGKFLSPITLTTLRSAMQPYCKIERGPKGGTHIHNPVDEWMRTPGRTAIAGVAMRPDMARPLYRDENRHLWLNRYTPPSLPRSGGSTTEMDRFLLRLLPDNLERAWFLNWLALKVQEPVRRMVAVAMVAADVGTGRGLLSTALTSLFGEAFTVTIPYAKISGGSGSRFNAEMADKLMVFVNESRDADDSKFAHRNAAREAFKEFIEPNHASVFRVEAKGRDAYYTRSSASTLIFTNHTDALPISANDRRVAVFTNGAQMTDAEVRRFIAWAGQPANIGAWRRALLAHKVEQDGAVFDPYMSPKTHGRGAMIEAGKTLLDVAWEQAVNKLRLASDLYAMPQIVQMTKHYYSRMSPGHRGDLDELIDKHTRITGYRIGLPQSTNWLVRWRGDKVRVYAHSDAEARRYSTALPHVVKAELDKAQKAAEAPQKAVNKLLKGIDGGRPDEGENDE
jgi:hypothetical protein